MMFPDYQANGFGKAANTRFKPEGGISLRDYFAAQAIIGILARNGSVDCRLDSDTAYRIADAMIKRRDEY